MTENKLMLWGEEIDLAIHRKVEEDNAEELRKYAIYITALMIKCIFRAGEIAKYFKDGKKWRGYAENYSEFCYSCFGVGSSAVDKYIRLYETYILKLNVPPKELLGAPQDKLDKLKTFALEQGWDKAKTLLELPIQDITEELKDANGLPPVNESKVDRTVSTLRLFTKDEKELAMKKLSTIAWFENSAIVCAKCGCRTGLDIHHLIFRSAGVSSITGPTMILCRKHHTDYHDGCLDIDRLKIFGGGGYTWAGVKALLESPHNK
ncbi:MAG: hypothetical protein GY853_13565 [PVC group bacterium]|nr:hypothetical protein [PVC group bacterium]